MKKFLVISITILSLVCLIFFTFMIIKKIKNGNNMSNKSVKEIEQYILNINSYEAEVEIEVNTNKNKNIYKANQKYIKKDNLYRQEIIEPENIKGTIISYDGRNLKMENTKLSLSKIYENYKYIGSTDISLIQFINDYNSGENKSIEEKNGNIILNTKIKNGSKYRTEKTLYVDKSNAMPVKLEIKDISQNTVVYILYNKIIVNNLEKEDVIAFKLKNINEDI